MLFFKTTYHESRGVLRLAPKRHWWWSYRWEYKIQKNFSPNPKSADFRATWMLNFVSKHPKVGWDLKNSSTFWWIENFWPPFWLLKKNIFVLSIFSHLIWLKFVSGAKIRFYNIFANYIEAPRGLKQKCFFQRPLRPKGRSKV